MLLYNTKAILRIESKSLELSLNEHLKANRFSEAVELMVEKNAGLMLI